VVIPNELLSAVHHMKTTHIAKCVSPNVKPRESSYDARYCNACPCRLGE